MILALFMVLTISILATSMMFVSQAETFSTQNYKLMSQSRYAAEAGVNSAANYLVKTYAPPTVAADLALYDMTVSPVKYAGASVVLSGDPSVTANYPVQAVKDAFNTAAHGTLTHDNGSVKYTAYATLLSMNNFNDVYSGVATTIQTWQITGDGAQTGARPSLVEVSTVIEQQIVPVFAYAAFATNNGCSALSLAGGGSTNSYDSTAPLVGGVPVTVNSGGNVGTNGNLDDSGATTEVYGSLSTPRSGVGTCTANNVTADTLHGATLPTGGLVQLSQPVTYPTPAAPSPMPPTTSLNITKTSGCGGVANCSGDAGVGVTLTAGTTGSPNTFGNIDINAQATVTLKPPAGGCGGPCVFNINSLTIEGNATLLIDPTMTDKVQINIGGKDSSGNWITTPINFAGNGTVTSANYDPSKFEILYAGTSDVKLVGGTKTVMTVLAPNASGKITGGSDFYGAIVTQKMTDLGGAAIHYDRNLLKSGQTVGSRMMNTFTWKTY
jgi:hypothetical protein